MSNGLLNASGLTTPQVTTDKILLEGEDLKDLLSNASTGDFVIETFKEGASWYRLYHSGWIEQGGKGGAATTTYAVTLLKEMADTNYSVNLTSYDYKDSIYNLICNNKTTTGFEIYGGGQGAKAVPKGWVIKGFIKTN